MRIEALQKMQDDAAQAARQVDAILQQGDNLIDGAKKLRGADPARRGTHKSLPGLLDAKIAYLRWKMKLPERACKELYWSKWVSLVMVSVVVVAGLCFAGVQLRAAVRLNERSLDMTEQVLDDTAALRILVGAKPVGEVGSLQTDLKLEDGKASTQTSVVGVLVLVISLAFYFLYLKFVFPKDVPELGDPRKPAASAGSPAPPRKP